MAYEIKTHSILSIEQKSLQNSVLKELKNRMDNTKRAITDLKNWLNKTNTFFPKYSKEEQNKLLPVIKEVEERLLQYQEKSKEEEQEQKNICRQLPVIGNSR